MCIRDSPPTLPEVQLLLGRLSSQGGGCVQVRQDLRLRRLKRANRRANRVLAHPVLALSRRK
eukprot:277559-Lingulodinium_polyedra.AAC.1